MKENNMLVAVALIFVVLVLIGGSVVLHYEEDVAYDLGVSSCQDDISYYKNLSYWEGINDGLFLSIQPAPQLTFRNTAEWREAVTSCLEFGVCG